MGGEVLVTPEQPRPHSPTLPGTHHFVNPRMIPADRDFVALSRLGVSVRWCGVIATIAVMVVAVYLILDGASGVGAGTVGRLFNLATNPIIGLLIGIVATAALQSSTTVTALTVAAVGTGGVSVPVAIPIILGANIGTTITPLLVSFSFVGDRRSFQRAFASASLHNWFNLVFVLLAFVLELLFHPLRSFSTWLSELLLGKGSQPTTTGNFVLEVISPVINRIGFRGWLGELFPPGVAPVISVLVGTVTIMVSMRVLSSLLATLMAAKTRTLMERSSGASDALGLVSGAAATALTQASSVVISSLLPFAVTRSLRQREILAITLGANVGTTLTALLTALAVPGSMGSFAIQAALVHVAFNLGCCLLVFFLKPLRAMLFSLAEFSGRIASGGYSVAAGFLAVGYLALPVVIIVSHTMLGSR
ncbi:Na+/Pi-cotransporter [Corynebacterium atrinae]|uniref:Na/Pi cotransporter family protein n=1 Tax=Corynebacterium atrinae TaxID=1336740 RepID=UPI0025B52842|nr:Na/Pi cotransporter family protein [Corynebacterium atrinae]WJY64396.1 Na+/Pi-cotransporter [Corynebacterium atrinae]